MAEKTIHKVMRMIARPHRVEEVGKLLARLFTGIGLIVVFCYGLLAVVAASFNQATAQQNAVTPNGATLYQQRCATCHDKPTERVPPRAAIALLPLDQIIQTMTSGAMKLQASGLSAAQIRAVATYLTGMETKASANRTNYSCKSNGGPLKLESPQWNGCGRDLDNSRYQPKPGLTPPDVPKLKVKWAFAYPGTRT